MLVEGSAPKPLFTHILCGSASFGCLWSRISLSLVMLFSFLGCTGVFVKDFLRVGAIDQQLFHLIPCLPVFTIRCFLFGKQGRILGLKALYGWQFL